MFLPHTMLNDGLDSCCCVVIFCQQFGLSFWRHPFTAEDPSVIKWSNAKILKICSSEEQLINILDVLRVSKYSATFFFVCVNSLFMSG